MLNPLLDENEDMHVPEETLVTTAGENTESKTDLSIPTHLSLDLHPQNASASLHAGCCVPPLAVPVRFLATVGEAVRLPRA